MRKQALIMAENASTPVGYWLSLPLCSFAAWIRANNSLQEERKAARDKARAQTGNRKVPIHRIRR